MTSAPKNLILDPSAPYNTALAFVETKYSNQSTRALHHYKGEFFYWTGTHYRPIETDAVRAEIYDLLDSADCPDKKESLMPFRATRTRVTDVQDALRQLRTCLTEFLYLRGYPKTLVSIRPKLLLAQMGSCISPLEGRLHTRRTSSIRCRCHSHTMPARLSQ